jgi:DNA-binding transcriptional MerR regulator
MAGLKESPTERSPEQWHFLNQYRADDLETTQKTPAGYQLYPEAAIDRCRRIESLKGRRLTLEEIRTELDAS